MKKRPKFTASRIDFFLVNYGLTFEATANIIPAIVTDHSAICLTIQIDSVKRGKGLWKLNSSHLADKDYIERITDVINETIFEFHKEIPDVKWEKIKTCVIQASKEFSKSKAQRNKQELNKLFDKLSKYKDMLSAEPDLDKQRCIVNSLEVVQKNVDKHYE